VLPSDRPRQVDNFTVPSTRPTADRIRHNSFFPQKTEGAADCVGLLTDSMRSFGFNPAHRQPNTPCVAYVRFCRVFPVRAGPIWSEGAGKAFLSEIRPEKRSPVFFCILLSSPQKGDISGHPRDNRLQPLPWERVQICTCGGPLRRAQKALSGWQCPHFQSRAIDSWKSGQTYPRLETAPRTGVQRFKPADTHNPAYTRTPFHGRVYCRVTRRPAS